MKSKRKKDRQERNSTPSWALIDSNYCLKYFRGMMFRDLISIPIVFRRGINFSGYFQKIPNFHLE